MAVGSWQSAVGNQLQSKALNLSNISFIPSIPSIPFPQNQVFLSEKNMLFAYNPSCNNNVAIH